MRTLARLICTLALAIPAVLPSAWAAERNADFSDAELDRMLAPIALYPDTVLSHVLIAATYPLEIVEAARWSRRNPDLRGEDAVAAVEDQDWDASVKALVAFPELLARMDEDLDWTQDLGDAFLAQEGEVADRVQVLRQRAYETGHLDSLEHVRVIREREVIYIEPAVTHFVYVPFYDTRVVYGGWWWPAFPPVYWGFPYGYYGSVWYWGVGYHIAPTFYFSSWYWPQRRVVVVNHVHHHHHFHSGREVATHREARQWRHDASHRRGVAYRNEQVRHEHASAQSNRPARRDQARVERRTDASDDRRQRTSQDRGNARRDENRQRDTDRSRRQPETATARPAPRDSERRSAREERVVQTQAERPARRERAPRVDNSAAEQRDEPRQKQNRRSNSQENKPQRTERAAQEPQREPAAREDREQQRARPDRQNGDRQNGARERGSKRQRAER